jgi:hypothetical protein
LGIGDWAQSPIPNPQSPIPNPREASFASKSALKYHIKCHHNKEKEKNLIKIIMESLGDCKNWKKGEIQEQG